MDDALLDHEIRKRYGIEPDANIRAQLKKNRPKSVVLTAQDLAAIRSVNTIGSWRAQSIAAKVREGKLPPEYLDFAQLTGSPAEEDDEEDGKAYDEGTDV
jgi:hypothetical protein